MRADRPSAGRWAAYALGGQDLAMMNMLDELEARLRNMSPETTYETRLWVGRTPDGVFVDFFGEPFSEEYSQFLLSLRSPETSKTLAAVRMSGPDEGSNGTKNWDLSELVAGEHLFPMLRSFHVERGLPGEHNRAIVAESYEEDGVLARLLEKAPDLMSLSSPSAPDSDFFRSEIDRSGHLRLMLATTIRTSLTTSPTPAAFQILLAWSLASTMSRIWTTLRRLAPHSLTTPKCSDQKQDGISRASSGGIRS